MSRSKGLEAMRGLLITMSMGWMVFAEIGPRFRSACAQTTYDRIEYSLPNGLRVRLVPVSSDKEVVVLLAVKAGFFEEPAGKPQLAHVAEHLVVHAARPGSPESAAFDRWFAAGKANAETLASLMYFDLRVPADEISTALRLQAARLGAPSFSQDSLTTEIASTLKEIENLERPELGYTSKFADVAFIQVALHGQKRVAIKERTRGYTLADVQNYWSRTFRCDRASLSIVGNFDAIAVRREVDATFGRIAAPSRPLYEAHPEINAGRRTAAWDLATRHVVIGWPVPPASDADHPALTLGAQMLMQRLSTDPKVTTLAKFSLVSNENERCFLINVAARPNTDLKALETQLLAQVSRLSGPEFLEAPAIAAIERSREALVHVIVPGDAEPLLMPRRFTKIMARANRELQRVTRELAWGDLASYRKRIETVTVTNLREAAAKHLDPARAAIVRIEPSP
jgi:predicted Zn-dependent peptidase